MSEAPQPAGWPFSDHSMHHRAHLPDSDEENGQDNDGRSGQPQGFYMHCPLRSLIIGREAKASQKFLSYVALPHKTFNGLLPCALTKPCTTTTPAILRETSRQTSYQMVRWVFRPYAQLRRTICTSVLRPASTTLSHGLTVTGYSSPPFGSRRRVLTLKTMFEKTRVRSLLQAAERGGTAVPSLAVRVGRRKLNRRHEAIADERSAGGHAHQAKEYYAPHQPQNDWHPSVCAFATQSVIDVPRTSSDTHSSSRQATSLSAN